MENINQEMEIFSGHSRTEKYNIWHEKLTRWAYQQTTEGRKKDYWTWT